MISLKEYKQGSSHRENILHTIGDEFMMPWDISILRRIRAARTPYTAIKIVIIHTRKLAAQVFTING